MKSLIPLAVLGLLSVFCEAGQTMKAVYSGTCSRPGYKDAEDQEFVIKQQLGKEATATLNSHKVTKLVVDGNYVSFDAKGKWKHGSVEVTRHFEGQFSNNGEAMRGTYTQQTGGPIEVKCVFKMVDQMLNAPP